jgi:hypothetical protein
MNGYDLGAGPATRNAFAPSIPEPTITGSISRLYNQLRNAVLQAARLTNVPYWLITVICAKEIQFKAFTFSNNSRPYATGVGQFTPLTFYDVYFLADTWGLITPNLKAFLAAKMGSYWPVYLRLAMQRQAEPAPYPNAIRLLRDPEINLVMCGIHLACLLRLMGGAQPGTPVNLPRLVLGYNRGVAEMLRQIAQALRTDRNKLVRVVARPDWVFPPQMAVSAAVLSAQQRVDEARKYILDHLAPGGYFDIAERLGLKPPAAM